MRVYVIRRLRYHPNTTLSFFLPSFFNPKKITNSIYTKKHKFKTQKFTTMNKKLLVILSHMLTEEQVLALQSEHGITDVVLLSDIHPITAKIVSQVDPNQSSEALRDLANHLIEIAQLEECTHICMQGEPCLQFHVWVGAILNGYNVLQSTTERISKDVVNSDGSVTKISVFQHVKWRLINY